MHQLFAVIRNFFEANFVQESTLIVMSVVFGGVITIIVNNGAMKKQVRFDMQRKILEELLKKAERFKKDIEALEIGISFKTIDSTMYNSEANEVVRLCLSLNEDLRTKRKFVISYVKAITVEKSAEMVSSIHKALCEFGEGGFADVRVKQNRDSEMISKLRALTGDAKELSKELTESLEKLTSPGIIARIQRLFRPARLFLGECWAIWRVGSLKSKRIKKK